ncbi:phosphocholine-specific phospholipase C [Lysobacter silvisoli]|uniref:phospholipase C n=1 Tax=Lysobacter silvisoli TaxID=2293254 RepID=A0A371K2M0_9GAMM|nr:phospholipase C, phosphocholine-specific [Lysobacter silvisoli]RDZ28112.1 phospholipase C, phosphocholine-specific [Lysobacter silvisoli]
MVSDSRRDFLKFAGAAASLAMLPPGIRAALATPAARVTGTIQDVQHVVILMQENRSFDHYLGALRGVRGFDDPRPISLPGGATVWRQPKSNGQTVLPFRLSTDSTAAQCLADIDHSWKGSHTRWKDYNAWIATKGPMCMGHFTRADLPYYYALADAFTVCDAYYCSHHGPTNPNRMHLFAGTSGMTVGDYGAQAVNNADDGNWTADMSKDKATFAGHRWTTYAERLQNAGIGWRVYQEYDNYGDNSLPYFANFRNLDRNSELYKRGRAWVEGSNAGNASSARGEHLIAAFAKDVREGTLPAVSWIVPSYIMSEHPAAPPAYGESLTSRLLDALVANPAVWSKTVFIINYDENGGFFDHLPPPLPPINSGLGKSTVDTATENYNGVPVGLGIRVPMFVVSPWSKGGWVNSQVFDHTSVLRFLEARFGVAEPNISAWRRAVAGDLSTALDFAGADPVWPALPDTSGHMARADQTCKLPVPTAPKQPQMPRQESGQRPARALPYELHTHGRIEASSGRYWLDFANTGVAGVGYTVYAANRSDGPWFYTLTPGTELSDYWSAKTYSQGKYDLAVHGPNGYLRAFKGDLLKATAAGGANPELRVEYDVANERLLLRLRNTGTGACRVTLRPNHYSSAAPRSYPLAAGATVDDTWTLAASAHWYDFSLTSDHDSTYLRRCAGHMETGRPSVSDPAIGA